MKGLRLALSLSAGGPSSFTPSSRAAQLKMWLRGDSIQFTGTTLNSWTDKSGNGNSATVNTGTPTYVASNASFNNQPTAHFPGTANLIVSSLNVSQPDTIYLVLKQTGNCNVLDGAVARQLVGSTGTPQWYYFASSAVTSGTTATTALNCLVAVFNGSSSALYNNASAAAIANGNPGANGINQLIIGSSSALAAPLTGDIAEIICTNVADSTSQISSMLKYLATRYGTAWT